jgi:tRNA uridine 5-carbamoylmethylation protein Kti12
MSDFVTRIQKSGAMKKIICLYGGPGAGKSTTCAGLFYRLKLAGYNCEMNREYIKEWVWEGRAPRSGDQTYFFAKMARRERLYMDVGLDFIITDSPLILTHFYGLKNDPYEQLTNTSLAMLKNHHQYCKAKGYKVEHFIIERAKPYSEVGRFETEEKARAFDIEIRDMLDSMSIKYANVVGDIGCVDSILKELKA